MRIFSPELTYNENPFAARKNRMPGNRSHDESPRGAASAAAVGGAAGGGGGDGTQRPATTARATHQHYTHTY